MITICDASAPERGNFRDVPWHPGLNANLDGMGYRGDDTSRTWADSRRQDPWPPEGAPASADRYGVYEQDPRLDGHDGQHDGPGRHGRAPGYGDPGQYGDRGQYGDPGPYYGGAPGGTDRPAGGFPDNDWYGDNRAGGFADTSIQSRPSIPDGYRPGDYDPGHRAIGAAPENVRPDPRETSPGFSATPDPFEMPSTVRPTTANPVFTGPAPTAANPVYREDRPAEFGAEPGYEAAGARDGRAGPPFPSGRIRPGGPRRSGNTRKKLVLGVSALCLIGALASIYVLLIMPGNEEATANAPLPGQGASSATAACVQKYGPYCHITYRSDDPKPLTVSELYPKAVLNEKDHISFQQIGTRTDKTCSDAALGSSLQGALKHCSQALRASYVSGSGGSEIMGTIGVFNLNSSSQAHSAGKNVGSGDFISPLATSSGVGANLGQSTGVMQSQYKGHYLILTWAELANENTPSKSDDQKLMQFENDLIASTANIALTQRMVSGKPGGSA